MDAVIKLEAVQFSYGSHQVLKNISCTVKQGEIIGLIGENGAGKTTLLNIILGALPANDQVTIFGQRPDSAAVKRRIGAMLQGDIVLPGVTVGELVGLMAHYAHDAMAPLALLQQLDLADLASQRINQLSGGQLRRVTFAMALVADPDLLFLDEPTVGMDVNARAGFWQQITALKAAGKTIVITSHYLEELQNVADRLFILKGGQLIFADTFAKLQQQYQKAMITFNTKLVPSQFVALPGVTAVEQNEAAQIQLETADSDATLKALQPFLLQLSNLTITKASLANIFTALTRDSEALS